MSEDVEKFNPIECALHKAKLLELQVSMSDLKNSIETIDAKVNELTIAVTTGLTELRTEIKGIKGRNTSLDGVVASIASSIITAIILAVIFHQMPKP